MKKGDVLVLKTTHKAYRYAGYAHLYKKNDIESFKKISGQTVVYDTVGGFFGWLSVHKKDGTSTMIKGYEIKEIICQK